MRTSRRLGSSLAFLVVALGSRSALATVINVSPADGNTGYTKIEGANPGDEVILAPGTYPFRVYLTQTAPAFLAWAGGEALAVTWSPADAAGEWKRYGSNGTLTLVSTGGRLRTTYAFDVAGSRPEAEAFAQKERDWLAANPNPP